MALTEFLSKIEPLGGNPLLRNMFPWFVYEQIKRSADGRPNLTARTPSRPEEAIGEIAAQARRIRLRHNSLSKHLCELLGEEYGTSNVFVEQPSGGGGWVDAILKHPNGEVWLYEIKVAATASLAVREALGQLLEYGFQKGGWNPEKLWVVAEPALDAETAAYLGVLRDRFQLPLGYLQVTL